MGWRSSCSDGEKVFSTPAQQQLHCIGLHGIRVADWLDCGRHPSVHGETPGVAPRVWFGMRQGVGIAGPRASRSSSRNMATAWTMDIFFM